jgi:hypothetical protein
VKTFTRESSKLQAPSSREYSNPNIQNAAQSSAVVAALSRRVCLSFP